MVIKLRSSLLEHFRGVFLHHWALKILSTQVTRYQSSEFNACCLSKFVFTRLPQMNSTAHGVGDSIMCIVDALYIHMLFSMSICM